MKHTAFPIELSCYLKITFKILLNRLKAPFLGEPDDGSITTYNDIWAETGKNSGIEHPDRMDKLNDGFQRYIGEYYWDAPVRNIF